MDKIAPYLKAFTAAVIAALTAASTGADDGKFSWADGIATAIAFFVALSLVWAVPNAPTEETPVVTPTSSRAKSA